MARKQLSLFDPGELGPPAKRPDPTEPWGAAPEAPALDQKMVRVRWGRRHGRTRRGRFRAWLRAASKRLTGRERRDPKRARAERRYAGRKGSARLIVSSRPGPTDRISTGTPTRASIRCTYSRAFLGRSSKFRQPRTSSVQPGRVS